MKEAISQNVKSYERMHTRRRGQPESPVTFPPVHTCNSLPSFSIPSRTYTRILPAATTLYSAPYFPSVPTGHPHPIRKKTFPEPSSRVPYLHPADPIHPTARTKRTQYITPFSLFLFLFFFLFSLCRQYFSKPTPLLLPLSPLLLTTSNRRIISIVVVLFCVP